MNGRWRVESAVNPWGVRSWWVIAPDGTGYCFQAWHLAFRFAVRAARGRVTA